MTVRIAAFVFALLLSSCVMVSESIAADSTAFQIIRSNAGLSLHKEMYMLPTTYSDAYQHAQMEAVFQISAKHRVARLPIYFGYTQISFWQAYDYNNSAPFRETNYNPELFCRTAARAAYGGFIAADFGFEHESNGQRPPVSRSWNLVYFSPYYFTERWLVHLKLRYRIPEDDKPYPGAAVGDDNPDITDYLGYSDLNLYFKVRPNRTLHLTMRGNLATGRGLVALAYNIPTPYGESSFLFARASYGYGESMVDYNRKIMRLGAGILFSH